jgi:hypothetical protein
MNFADKAGVIGQLWIEFRNDEDFSKFMEYNDLGCPLAYMIAEGIAEPTPLGTDMVEETFKMFSMLVDVTEEQIDELENINLISVLELGYKNRQAKEEE